VLALLAGYVAADAYDVVPGVLTTSPPEADAQPYPGVRLPGPRPVAATVDALDPDAPVPDAAAVEAAIARVVDESTVGGDISVRVLDAATGDLLAERDPDVSVPVASSAKILTAAGALYALGPETRFTTRVVTAGGGLIVLVGGGDVLLGPNASDPEAVRGHAGLGDLADQVATELESSGTTSVTLAVDDSSFTGEPYAADVEGLDQSFTMAATTVAVNTGAVDGAYTADPAMGATEAFAERLRERGIEVTVEGRHTTSDADRTIASVESATVSQIVREMLVDSDNAIADVLSRLVALERDLPGDAASGGQAVVNVLAELGIDTSGTHMIDGAGLSISDSATATSLTDLLQLSQDGSVPEIAGLVPSLPVSSLDGTLGDRLGGEGAGRVRAKTGSLVQYSSLTGTVLTVDERLLTFSVIMHSFDPGGLWEARALIDSFVDELANCGCSGS
jgi:D-alanyl-D-alanine carboxypeptidase/D-alanyl-D-alanine-endopeptidase (penicillin-binding protein 4)